MSKGKFAIGALLGAAAGFITGILTAPKSGKETRVEIEAKTNEIKADVTKEAKIIAADAVDVAEDVKEKAKDVVCDVKLEATDLKNRTERAIDGAKKGFFSKK